MLQFFGWGFFSWCFLVFFSLFLGVFFLFGFLLICFLEWGLGVGGGLGWTFCFLNKLQNTEEHKSSEIAYYYNT